MKRASRNLLAALAIVCLFMDAVSLLWPGTALAADQVVTNTNDSGAGSLREAIQLVHNGGAITFSLGGSPATIVLTGGELAISKTLTISGPGAGLLTVSGNHASRVFRIFTGTVAIAGLTIAEGQAAGGPAEGGAIHNAGTLILQQVMVQDSRADGAGITGPVDARGGGIFNAGVCLLMSSTLYSNTAQGGPTTVNYGGAGDGGGIYSSGVLTISDSALLNNLARGGTTTMRYGGAAYGGGVSSALTGTLAIAHSTVSGNRAEGGDAPSDRYGGTAYGGGIRQAGAGSLRTSDVLSNTALGGAAPRYGGNGDGGGISLANLGSLDVWSATVRANLALGKAASIEYAGSAEGGGIHSRGVITLTQSAIISNTAQGATGVVAGDGTAGGISAIGSLHIANSSVCNNKALGGNGVAGTFFKIGGDGDAGGIYSFALSGAAHTLTNSTICNNLAQGGAGDSAGDATAGGIYNYYTLTVESTLVAANVAQGGASAANGHGGRSDGGGLYGLGALTVWNSTIRENASLGGPGTGGYSYGGGGYGGGIAQGYGGAFAIVASTLFSNTAQGGSGFNANGGNGVGGGYSDSYASYTPTVRFTNSTIHGNRAIGGSAPTTSGKGMGGGLSSGVSMAAISFCTISGNNASDQGGGLFTTTNADDSGPAIKNTILSGNSAAAGADIYNNVQSRGYNLVQNASGGTLDIAGGANTAVGNLLGADPQLGPLQDNGGPTWTRVLLDIGTPSPAVNAGSPTDVAGDVVPTDQRGGMRPYPPGGKTDIGAVERQGPVYRIYLPLIRR